MIKVPKNTIAAIPFWEGDAQKIEDAIVPFAGMKKRDWFSTHAYYCLPLTIGNQYGFGIKTLDDLSFYWNGGRGLEDSIVTITKVNGGDTQPIQDVKSHFGDGIITIQNRWTLRTPPYVNLITMDPPNIINDGIRNLTAVIETDNLRRDFTFNVKITRPNEEIFIPAGTIISAFMPIPRFFVEEYNVVDGREIFTNEELRDEWEIQNKFTELRAGPDVNKAHQAGRLYYNGEDAYGNKYKYEHQRSIRKNK